MADDVPAAGRSPGDDELYAIPRLAERVGVSPRVLRYWEELGLISPTSEHGRLRYSPRDMAIARLTKRLIDAGESLDGLVMLKELTERDIRHAGRDGDAVALTELALRILYQRKAFRDVAGMEEQHYPEDRPEPPNHGPHPKGAGPKRHGPAAKRHGPSTDRPQHRRSH